MGKGCFRRPPRRMGNYRLSVNDGCPRHIAHPAYPIYHLSRPSARLVLHREQAKLSRNGRALDTRSLGQKSHLPGDTWSQMPSGAVLGQLLLKKNQVIYKMVEGLIQRPNDYSRDEFSQAQGFLPHPINLMK